MNVKEDWRLFKRAFRWNIAAKLLTWMVRLTRNDMDGPCAQAAWAFVEHFRRINNELNGPQQ